MTDPSAFELLAMPPLGYVLAGLFGALWGSFFNVAIHRLAREDASVRSLVHPPSRCPVCATPIRWYDNVPLLSWVILRGRCRSCSAPISWRYPLVELLCLGLGLAVYQRFCVGQPDLPSLMLSRYFAYYFFSGTLVVLSFIDLDTMLLPEVITLPAIPIFFLAGRVLGDVTLVDAGIGLLVGFGSLKGLQLGYAAVTGREGLGGGDAVLMALVGGFLGWRALPVTLGLGATLGTVVTIPLLIAQRRRTKASSGTATSSSTADTATEQPATDGELANQGEPSLRHVEVPFGPFLCAAALLYMFLGRYVADLVTAWVEGP